MKNIYTTEGGQEVVLSENEIKVMRILNKLEKMDFERIRLFGNGSLSVRLGGGGHQNEIAFYSIPCDGGDGGDVFN